MIGGNDRGGRIYLEGASPTLTRSAAGSPLTVYNRAGLESDSVVTDN